VLAARNPKEILAIESVGTYLEQYIENVSQIDKKFYPTLGMLYQEQENCMETLYIPLVESQNNQPVITGYCAWVRGTPGGEVDEETVCLSAFTAGDVDNYTLQIQEDNYIKLFDSHSVLTVKDNTIHVKVCCNGEVLCGTEKKKENLRALAENYMTETAQNARQIYGIDVTNSYKKLGGLNRELYFYYRQNPGEYEQDMNIVYELEITWVNL
jgi:hypothetical protein